MGCGTERRPDPDAPDECATCHHLRASAQAQLVRDFAPGDDDPLEPDEDDR
jgi:hypothetical protein